MTKKQFWKNFNELKRESLKAMTKKAEKALKSGAIDLKSYEDDFRLPKVVMTAICENLASNVGWKPHDKKLLNELKNLRYFI